MRRRSGRTAAKASARKPPELKELADKTRRGLRGRIENGKAGGGLSYGYRVGRRFENGALTTGEREINEEEAAVVRRIFRDYTADYTAGASPKHIAKALNREGIPGPRVREGNGPIAHGAACRLDISEARARAA